MHDHETGRRCPMCQTMLLDSVINFGENLPEKHLAAGISNSKKSDLCLVLGSSLTVTPAADLPKKTVKCGGRLVICNMQKTPLDEIAALRVFARTDTFMKMVMEELHIPISKWMLQRRLKLQRNTKSLRITGLSRDNLPDSFIKTVMIKSSNNNGCNVLNKEPFEIKETYDFSKEFDIVLEFMGHYNEPNLTIHTSTLPSISSQSDIILDLAFDLYQGQWSVNNSQR